MNDHVIEATGVAWEYFVSSASNPNAFHVVNLAENFPAGTCSCIQWTCRINPHNRKTGDTKKCRHILACRDSVINYVIKNAVITK